MQDPLQKVQLVFVGVAAEAIPATLTTTAAIAEAPATARRSLRLRADVGTAEATASVGEWGLLLAIM